MSYRIPQCEPNICDAEKRLVNAALDTNNPALGVCVERFEELVAQATGREWCVATSSGTGALRTALTALGVKGATVSVPSFTFAATVNAIIQAGGYPYFMDIDENWVAADIENGEGETKRITTPFVSVEVNGNPTRGTIIDACQSLGRGKIGGQLACLSFNGNKIITTGGGGAIIGDDPNLEAECRHYIRQCTIGKYLHDGIGSNERMPNLNAALGVAQMQRLGEFVEKKAEIALRYEMKIPYPPLPGKGTWLSGYIHDDALTHISTLQEMGIEAQPFFFPLHLQGPYKDFGRDPLPNTEAIWDRIVTLPSSTTLTETQQQQVIDAVLSLPAAEQTAVH